jgi:hypothetical protein
MEIFFYKDASNTIHVFQSERLAKKFAPESTIQSVNVTELLEKIEHLKKYLSSDKFSRDNYVNRDDVLSRL